jgi:hypothetical protein
MNEKIILNIGGYTKILENNKLEKKITIKTKEELKIEFWECYGVILKIKKEEKEIFKKENFTKGEVVVRFEEGEYDIDISHSGGYFANYSYSIKIFYIDYDEPVVLPQVKINEYCELEFDFRYYYFDKKSAIILEICQYNEEDELKNEITINRPNIIKFDKYKDRKMKYRAKYKIKEEWSEYKEIKFKEFFKIELKPFLKQLTIGFEFKFNNYQIFKTLESLKVTIKMKENDIIKTVPYYKTKNIIELKKRIEYKEEINIEIFINTELIYELKNYMMIKQDYKKKRHFNPIVYYNDLRLKFEVKSIDDERSVELFYDGTYEWYDYHPYDTYDGWDYSLESTTGYYKLFENVLNQSYDLYIEKNKFKVCRVKGSLVFKDYYCDNKLMKTIYYENILKFNFFDILFIYLKI